MGTATDWVKVSQQGQNSCGIRGSNRDLYCWGSGQSGGVGDGGSQDRLVPTAVAVPAGSSWSSVGGGSSFDRYTCALRQDDKIFCWGSQAAGALGDGVLSGKNVPARLDAQTSWLKVSGGDSQACALRGDGALFCWGDNQQGMLGNGTLDLGITPQRVGTFTDWSDISVGLEAATTCGIRQSRLYCWGANSSGQQGNGVSSPDPITSPQPVTVTNGPVAWSQVATAPHVCAIGTADASLWCWGDNSFRQILDSDVQLVGPTRIGSLRWKQVSVGSGLTCALRDDDTLWCWGQNGAGQLGDGTTVDRLAPTQVGTDSGWTGISVGLEYSCGIRAGALYCWGFNGSGQLGDGTSISRLLRVRVGTANDWSQVAAADAHTCATRLDGSLHCWGWNYAGEIGDGSYSTRYLPTDIGPATAWKTLTTGGALTCGIQDPGSLWCWGEDSVGALGLGPFFRTTPASLN